MAKTTTPDLNLRVTLLAEKPQREYLERMAVRNDRARSWIMNRLLELAEHDPALERRIFSVEK
jgi:hypothetical protein